MLFLKSLMHYYQEFKKSSKEFQEATEEKLKDIDKRIEALEK